MKGEQEMDRYIKFTVGTPYAGTEDTIYEIYSGNTTDNFLNEMLKEYIYNNAESYEYLATGWGEDFESEEDEEDYYADCWGEWIEITKQEFKEENDYDEV